MSEHTQEAFVEAINADPADFETRRVYADWLEERGDPSAAGWRVLNETGRVPKRRETKEAWTFWQTEDHISPAWSVIHSIFCPWASSAFTALQTAAYELSQKLSNGVDIEADKWPGQAVHSRRINGVPVKVLPRAARRACEHNWNRVYDIPSWRFACDKCGGCRR